MSLLISVTHLLNEGALPGEHAIGHHGRDISGRIADLYSELLQNGARDDTVVCAMLGAVVTIAEAMELNETLPGVLRFVAHRVEQRALLDG